MHAVALTARKLANLLLLVAALEVESADISTRIHGALVAELQHVEAIGNFLPHRLVGIERVAALVDIAELHGGTDLQRAGIRLFLPREHAEQRRLAGAVRA